MKQKILFVICLLFGLMFINAGLDKFLHYMPVPKDLPEKMMKMGGAFMEIGWLMPLVGMAEIIGGILFIIPRTRPLGALVIFPILIGITLTTITAAPSGLAIPLVLLAIELFVIYDNRHKYLMLVK